MTLTWPIVFAVLCGALLHAGWNALIKSGRDSAVDTALVHVLGALVALPIVLGLRLPPAAAWPFVAVSLVIHVGYYTALAGAYRHGELGLTYPIMRGFAPLLVALASGALIGEAPSPLAWCGIVAVAAGVALVGLAHPGQALHHRKALAFAFTNAVIIAMYTVVDGHGARVSASRGVGATVGDGLGALRYVMLLSVLDGVTYPLSVWLRRSASQRAAIAAYARRRWPVAALGGAASIGSYAIALWAMTRAPIASVAALRETSVLFAALLGTLLLKERFGLQRAIGTGVIVAGVMALRLG
ncbi:MAG: EamA family transporter [Burkholderiales bacterium]|nr:EamA family transporter [Burkholderiales bacterium]MDE2627307.1 EamA family transporter [Burkholderiales bacterium]